MGSLFLHFFWVKALRKETYLLTYLLLKIQKRQVDRKEEDQEDNSTGKRQIREIARQQRGKLRRQLDRKERD